MIEFPLKTCILKIFGVYMNLIYQLKRLKTLTEEMNTECMARCDGYWEAYDKIYRILNQLIQEAEEKYE